MTGPLHHTVTGDGPPVLLLHGWPQSSHAWRRVAALLPGHRIVTVDLRGFGDSPKPRAGYDAATMADDLHAVVTALGLSEVTVVGHDWGAVFAYALAASHPGTVRALGIVEMALPGLGMLEAGMVPRAGGAFLWHLGFHSVPDVPELVLHGNERAYIAWFFDHHAHDPAAIPEADRDRYAAALGAPGALRASLGVYRAYFETAAQITALAASPLTVPVVAYGGDASLGGLALESARLVAPDAQGGVIPGCGHWAPEEAPERVAAIVRELVAA